MPAAPSDDTHRPWCQSCIAITDRATWRVVLSDLTDQQREAIEARARELGIPVSPPVKRP